MEDLKTAQEGAALLRQALAAVVPYETHLNHCGVCLAVLDALGDGHSTPARATAWGFFRGWVRDYAQNTFRMDPYGYILPKGVWCPDRVLFLEAARDYFKEPACTNAPAADRV